MFEELRTIDAVDASVYGLPHKTFRPTQWDAIKTIHQAQEQFIIFEAPTGSGKSGIATAMGRDDNVTVLVGTLNLLEQYQKYGFKIIKGRGNYTCALTPKIQEWARDGKMPTAADCHYSPMDKCPAADECEYLQVKQEALASNRLAVTYPYAMLSYSVQQRRGILVCDECHEAVEQIIGFAEFSIGEYKRQQYNLPSFPFSSYGESGKGDLLSEPAKLLLYAWIDASAKIVIDQAGMIGEDTEEGSRMMQFAQRLERLYLDVSSGDWFLECGPGLVRERMGRNEWRDNYGMRLRALTAQTVAPTLWKNKSKIVLMSATIGDPEPIINELGIEEYFWKTYPHAIPVEYRPIYDLGVGRLTHSELKKNPGLFQAQANIVAGWIADVNEPSWRGIVLTSSYFKIQKMLQYLKLSPMLKGRRIMAQSAGVRIDRLAEQFINDRKPGDILIASIQGFGHGIDLTGDLSRWAVVAGVPHVNPTDRYEILRKKRPGGGKYAWWKAYAAIPQGTGRVSRGEVVNGEYLLNTAALADGSATTGLALKNYPGWFNEAIQKW